MMNVVAAALLLCFGLSLGDDVHTLKGHILVRETTKPPPMTISLNGGQISVLTRVDGSFAVENLKAGKYSLEVVTTEWTFPFYTVTVSEAGKIRATFYNAKQQRRDLASPLKIQPYAKPVYFEPRKQMNLASMFMNPMGLMMLFMLFTVVILPKMMANMDPEEMKKMQEEMKMKQQDQPDPSKMISNMFGGAGAEDSSDDEE
mmetsp:Transcript_19891/g.32719  ORF Transcript_19891/g.32719 Transcript_19891/m.32719 type:complete len:202 (-) Transcript_19891:2205-2810(-)